MGGINDQERRELGTALHVWQTRTIGQSLLRQNGQLLGKWPNRGNDSRWSKRPGLEGFSTEEVRIASQQLLRKYETNLQRREISTAAGTVNGSSVDSLLSGPLSTCTGGDASFPDPSYAPGKYASTVPRAGTTLSIPSERAYSRWPESRKGGCLWPFLSSASYSQGVLLVDGD